MSVMKKTFILLFLMMELTAVDLMAQLPPQTVVFKVRKVQRETIKIAVIQDQPFIGVEEIASFRGGDVNTFRTWVQQNLRYPTSVAEAGISGKVFVQFCVDTGGRTCNVKVLRGIHPDLDKEVVRCINTSPEWIPAKQGGRAVMQQFVMPVIFSLQKQ